MRLVKQVVTVASYSTKLLIGIIFYLISRKTPVFAYKSMITLFCLTGGYSNDLISRSIAFFKKPYDLENVNGILGNMADRNLRTEIEHSLKESGFHIFKNRLPESFCESLLEYATTHPCNTRPMDGESKDKTVATVYHRGSPQAVRYEFKTQDLLENPDVQELLADLSFAVIAQDYLGSRPIVDVIGMWWHTAYLDKPDKNAAQYYHFDMDRPKWLKFFIYLTDVKKTSGPHTFVVGSHKTRSIPPSMLKKGYARLADDEVESFFGKKSVVEFVAPRGTIIAEDTRGLHKAKHVTQDDRLVMQIQFSNSLFGGYYPNARMHQALPPNLHKVMKRFPGLYSAYI